jgi:LPS-assembly protein
MQGADAANGTREPVDVKADCVTYDAKEQTLEASGHVLLTQRVGKALRTLRAARIVYNQGSKTIKAFSSPTQAVIFDDVSGDHIEADQFEISDDFKEGTIQSLTLFTTDKETMHADKGKRSDGNISSLITTDYTPCHLCSHSAPTWQIKADEVIHDREKKTIVYKNARMEIKGIPILYTPYFSHPDPTVKRQSGILFPAIGQSKTLGMISSIPVYYAASDQKDLTLTPVFTSKQGPIMMGEYRQRYRDGYLKMSGSYTRTRGLPAAVSNASTWNGPRMPKPDRWNLAVRSDMHINDEQRVSLDVNRASDTTYLTRYRLTQQSPFVMDNKNMRSTLAWEHFREKSYVGIRSYVFQTDAPKTTPLVMPKGNYHYQTKVPKIGGFAAIEGDFLGIRRQSPILGRVGTETYRYSQGVDWKRPWVLPYGQIVTFRSHMRTDAYVTRRYFNTIDATVSANQSHIEHRNVRVFPQASLEWQWPFRRYIHTSEWIVKPEVMLVTSPNSLNNKHIPNEDSSTFELDDINTFMANRFDGIDRVDRGQRVIGGIENEWRFTKQRKFSIFVGQARRLDHQYVVPHNMGENNTQSDLLIRIKARPSSWFASRYRVAGHDSMRTIRYSELGATVGEPIFKLDVAHVFLNKTATIRNRYVSQLNTHISSQINEKWRVSIGQIRNIKKNNGDAALGNFFAATYEDECITVEAGGYKTGFHDRDIKPDTGFLLRLSFKNLGAFTPTTAPRYPGSMLTQLF